MNNANVYLPLTSENVAYVKRALRERFADVKSSHLTEALARALGRRTNAALGTDLSSLDAGDPDIVLLDESAFAARLAELTGRPPYTRPGLFHELPYDKGAEVIRTWSPDFDDTRYNTDRRRAWRNIMIAAVNAGIEQRLFSMRKGDNRWPGANAKDTSGHPAPQVHYYRFSVEGIPALASVEDRGFDELYFRVVFWPRPDAEQWLPAIGEGFRAGDACADGWIERRDAAHLQTTRRASLKCRKARLATVAALTVEPRQYADRGSFRM